MATTYYFDPSAGSDDHDGRNKEKAWRTPLALKRLLGEQGELPPGSGVLLRGAAAHARPFRLRGRDLSVGSYGGDRATLSVAGETAFDITASGTLSLSGLVAAGDGRGVATTGFGVVWETEERPTFWKPEPQIHLDYLEARGFTRAGLQLLYAEDAEVRDCRFDGNGIGAEVTLSKRVHLTGIACRDNGLETGPQLHEGKAWTAGVLLEGCQDVTLEHFDIQDTGHRVYIGAGVWISNAQGGNVVRHGRCARNTSRLPVHSGDGQDILVSGNSEGILIHDNALVESGIGVAVMADLEGGLTENVVVRDNVAFGSGVGLQLLGAPGRLRNVLLARNTVLGAGKALDITGRMEGVCVTLNDFLLGEFSEFLYAENLAGCHLDGNLWQTGADRTPTWRVGNTYYDSLRTFQLGGWERHTRGLVLLPAVPVA